MTIKAIAKIVDCLFCFRHGALGVACVSLVISHTLMGVGTVTACNEDSVCQDV